VWWWLNCKAVTSDLALRNWIYTVSDMFISDPDFYDPSVVSHIQSKSHFFKKKLLSVLRNVMRKVCICPSPSSVARCQSKRPVVFVCAPFTLHCISWQAGSKVEHFHSSNTSWGISSCQLYGASLLMLSILWGRIPWLVGGFITS
jgi:hypothetical protein